MSNRAQPVLNPRLGQKGDRPETLRKVSRAVTQPRRLVRD
jgi:hypothetical protein